MSGVGLQGRDLATLPKSETNGGVSCFLGGSQSVGFVRWPRASQGLPDAQGPEQMAALGRAPRGLRSPKSPVCSCLPHPHSPAAAHLRQIVPGLLQTLNSLCSFRPPVCLPGKTFLCGAVKGDRFWVLSLTCWHRELVWFVGFRAYEVSALPAEAGEHAAGGLTPGRAGGRGARPGLPAGHRRRTLRRDLSVKSSLK